MDDGSLHVTDTIEVQINGLFVMGLTCSSPPASLVLLFRLALGLAGPQRCCRTVNYGGRRRHRYGAVDRYTFGLGCGIAGVAGTAFTMIGSTRSGEASSTSSIPSWWSCSAAPQSLLGTIASAFTISQAQSTLEFFMSGSMAKVLTLLAIVAILMMRPQGLFALKVRK